MANFEMSPRVEPNETITPERAFLPYTHRGVLDLKRQLIVGNRGMGKSFWTHALLNDALRARLSEAYDFPQIKNTYVSIGFNGSEKKVESVAATTDDVSIARENGEPEDRIWRAVLLRSALRVLNERPVPPFSSVLERLKSNPEEYSDILTATDTALSDTGHTLLVVFDALDRLAVDWADIRALTKALLMRTIGLQSFKCIRVKIFMRVDQFADPALFQFPDSSKIRNDRVSLVWNSFELYQLLFFEILRQFRGAESLREVADRIGASACLPTVERRWTLRANEQIRLVNAIAGEFMGTNKKRGRVYTWVPLHLSDAANTCSPRTFLIAWKTAAEHTPSPPGRSVDHLGLIEGVRSASSSRLEELYEDYPWIQPALGSLHRQFVPIAREQLFDIWQERKVPDEIVRRAEGQSRNTPVGFEANPSVETLLAVLRSVAVMEERANGKINVPDIFRVDAGIMRKGGVAVPRKVS